MKSVILVILGVSVSLGAPPVHPKDSLPVTEALVDQWTKDWQDRLDLRDWQITTQIVRISELKPDTLGNLRWDNKNRTANIRVMNPQDYTLPASQIQRDIEYTIVHELVHLQLAALPRDPNGKAVEERVVNKIASALFRLEKGVNYPPHSGVERGPMKPAA